MNSPLRASDQSRSTPRSSPSRPNISDSRNGRANGFRHAHRSSPAQESPSRQLLEEFEKLYLNEERNFRESLDASSAEQERKHRAALDEALRKHEAVRESAERAREQLELEIQRERQRRIDEEKRALEETRRQLAEEETAAERRRLEEAKRLEEERKQYQAVKREREEQERQTEAYKQQDAKDKADRDAARKKEDADRKAREEAAEKLRSRQAQQASHPPAQQQSHQPQTNGTAFAAPPSAPAIPVTQTGAQPQTTSEVPDAFKQLFTGREQRETVHKQYVSLHQRLKKMRSTIYDQCKAIGAHSQLSDMRRGIRAEIAKLNKQDKESNRDRLKKVRAILNEAARIPEPSVDISQYLVFGHDTPPSNTTGVSTAYPGVLLFLLNHLAKITLAQLVAESGVDTQMADPIGVLLCTIFSVPDFRWNDQSLIDILWAKYHVMCPPLFGISGPENTAAGRERNGWKAKWGLSSAEHYQRMTGLGAGFSALTLRDFTKSRNRNPTPNRLWWESMARILNTPVGETTVTHYVLVKSIIEDFVPRIISTFGAAGKAVLKQAILEFPKKGPKKAMKAGEAPVRDGAAVAVESMRFTLQQKYNITL